MPISQQEQDAERPGSPIPIEAEMLGGKDPSGNIQPARISTAGDITIADGIASGGAFGNLTLTTANTAYEAKVGGARLSGRKLLTAQAVDADIYWGYANTVTTSSGTLINKGATGTWALNPIDSGVQVWLVCSLSSKNARITES